MVEKWGGKKYLLKTKIHDKKGRLNISRSTEIGKKGLKMGVSDYGPNLAGGGLSHLISLVLLRVWRIV